MNEMQLFVNEEFGDIRGFNIKGEPWVVGKDIAEMLGYASPRSAVSKKVEKEDRGVAKMETPSGIQEVTVINESGLYSLILSSKLPSAKKFKRWVTSEVLPTLRKNGTYSITTKPDSYTIEDPAARARRWAEEYEEKKALMVKVEHDAPMVAFASQVSEAKATDCIDFSAMAKVLKDKDINIGRNKLFALAKMFKWLRPNNEPYQEYVNRGYFTVVEYVRNGKPMVKTLITGKGQLFITNKILEHFKE